MEGWLKLSTIGKKIEQKTLKIATDVLLLLGSLGCCCLFYYLYCPPPPPCESYGFWWRWHQLLPWASLPINLHVLNLKQEKHPFMSVRAAQKKLQKISHKEPMC